MRPDWWKLPPLTQALLWREIGDTIRAGDPQCRGILILGLDSKDDGLKEAFAAASAEELVRGFAVGRLMFWSVAEEWFTGRLGDADAVARIAERYRHVSSLWQAARR